MRLFFTLYILSIFTHEMYMIGMHIIFLLTNGFNKAPSTCCNPGRLSFRSPRHRLVSVATVQRRGGATATLVLEGVLLDPLDSGIEECSNAIVNYLFLHFARFGSERRRNDFNYLFFINMENS